MKKSISKSFPALIVSPEQGITLPMHSNLQFRCSYGEYIPPVLKEPWGEKGLHEDASHPEAITVKWKNPFKRKCTLFLSDNRNFHKAESRIALYSKKICNLVPGKEYFLKVVCGKHSSETVSFFTAYHLPRYIHWILF